MPEENDMIIDQFIWGYQSAFHGSVEVYLRMALREIGFTGRVDVLLVGFQEAGEYRFPICIEPEDGPYAPSILDHARSRGQELYEQHPDRNMIHTDPTVHEETHERLRRQMQARAVEEALAASEPGADRSFFAGMPMRVDDYDVHTVISVDRESLASVPQLKTTVRDRFTVYPSLVHAVIHDVLNRASRGLSMPDPGRDYDVLNARPSGIVQGAAASFVRSIFGCAGYWFADKADAIVSAISALPYEGRPGSGRLVIAKAEHTAVDVLMKFGTEVNVNNTRAVRKLLEASGNEGDLLSTGEKVLGLGRLTAAYDPATETAFAVSVTARGTWELSHADQVLMTVRDSAPQLPRPPLNAAYFTDVVERLLPDADQPRLLLLAEAAGQHQHGAMLVISSDAVGEAQRLAPQAWTVEPALLPPELLRQLTSMDGGVLIDGQGYCHAIGVIVDGQACGDEDPARGSRYNNAVRYLHSEAPQAVVVVYSADGGIDILPYLRRRVKQSTVQQAMDKYLSLATPGERQSGRADAWDQVIQLNFYLSEDQCRLLNEAKEAVEQWNEEHNDFREIVTPFAPDPDMNESYWLPEEDEAS
jgi:hypothetical protein